MATPALEAVSIRYGGPAAPCGPTELRLERGETLLLCPPASERPGALLRVLATLEPVEGGELRIAGDRVGPETKAARAALAWLPERGGYLEGETAEDCLARAGRWRKLPKASLADARERCARWHDGSWPDAPLDELPPRARFAVRLAVATAHRPVLLIAERPLDASLLLDRPSVAGMLASCVADGSALVLLDGSGEAQLLADRFYPAASRPFWVEAAWSGSIAALQEQMEERGLSGRWRVTPTGGSCRLGPFGAAAEAQQAASWILTASPAPRRLQLSEADE